MLQKIWEWCLITVGAAITAAAVFFFLMPSHLAVGSISGLAIVLSELTGLGVSLITLALNIALLVVGLVLVGRDFGVKTIYTSLVLPVALGVLERMFPDFTSIMGDPFLDMVCYIFLAAAGCAMLFNLNASSGGLDIVAKILNKFFRMELGTAMSLTGACAFRILWIYTIFAMNRTLPTLYISYPVSWGITFAAHMVCYLLVLKKVKKGFDKSL